MSGFMPLKGYRVVDFGTAMAGPVLGACLADMGAEVIKVESRTKMDGMRLGRPIVGDDIAGGDQGKWPDIQPAFHNYNRGKLGITVDLKQPEGISLVKDLIKISDIVADNFSCGVLQKLGLDHKALQQIKPDIVTVSLTGAGEYGPLSNATTYAITITALGGLNSLLGYYGEPLLGSTAVTFGDGNGTVHGLFALLAALYHRNETGEGQHVEVSEWEACTSLLGEAITDYVMNGRVPLPQGNRSQTMAPHNNYRCQGQDKWVSIAVGSDREWQGFCRALGNPWTAEERFDTMPGRLANQEELDKLVTAWTISRTPQQVVDILQQEGVAAMEVLNIGGQYFDPHLQARHSFVEVTHPVVGVEPLCGIPWTLSDTPGRVERSAPSLGEHNDYVFGKLLGLSAEKIKDLVERKILN